ncbi:hypothetical protein S7711_03412 [Stachybotrys chartarum IBT 7711]|uniref:Heterokaryon incompatibility domain-containing protein n=1 Tax=Stachybotrys chartarum (strain CBS 109288 / IBT 7711) TaxID=1280523 RepID=A0A084AY13_STACB|nr:hypothetical protein S7711_03412 [Stachybotrys chartarum IBT 7711]
MAGKHYLYSPLDGPSKEIRLLEVLEPQSYNGSHAPLISCSLQNVSLENDPEFVALSYVWGDASVTETILVNSQERAVTTNLANALRHVKQHWVKLGRTPTVFRLWADAICINQEDFAERTSQVQLMERIYTSADVVFCWLSPENDELPRAFDLLDKIYGTAVAHASARIALLANEQSYETVLRVQNHHKWARWDTLTHELRATYDAHIGCNRNEGEPEPSKIWYPLSKLLGLPYWERVWIWQEVILAKRLLFLSGSTSYPAEKFHLATWLLEEMMSCPDPVTEEFEYDRARNTSAVRMAYHRQLFGYGSDSSPKLGKIMMLFASTVNLYKATDPRDKVYGFLALTKLPIVPDYRVPIGQVYLEYGRLFISEMQAADDSHAQFDTARLRLKFLGDCAAGINNSLGIPTWVPAFQDSRLAYLERLSHDSTFKCASEFGAYVDGGSLWTPGAKIHHIQECYDDIFDEDLRTSDLEALIARLTELCGETYVTSVPILKALCCVLSLKTSWPDGVDPFSIFPSQIDKEETDGSDEQADQIIPAAWTTIREQNKACKLIVSNDGHLGVAGKDARVGDIVCLLTGCVTSVLLRPVDDHYLFVGPCFVLGLQLALYMEPVDPGGLDVEMFEIR